MEPWVYAVIIAAVIILLGIIASGYVKAPPDRAFIISGLKREPKILIGRAGIKLPFLQTMSHLIANMPDDTSK